MTPVKRRLLIFVLCAAAYVFSLLMLQDWVGLGLQERLLRDRESALCAQVTVWKAGVKKETFSDTSWVRPLYASLSQVCPALRHITLLDDKGRIQFSTDPERNSGAEQSPVALDLLRNGKTGFYPGNDPDAGGLYLLAAYADKGKSAGGASFAFDCRDIKEALQDLLFRLRLALAGIFLFCVIVVFLITERAAGLNREMQRGLYLLGSGNFAFQVKSTQLGEAGEVFARFNEAVAMLKLREERKNTLLEKAKLLGVDMRFDTLFDNLMKGIREELSADNMLLLVIKDETLVVGAMAGYDEKTVFKEEVYRIQEDVFTEVLEYGKPIFLEDASEIRNNVRYGAVLRQSGEVALFPVTLGNEIYGILHVARAREKGPFKTSEVDAGIILCGGAAVAMTHLAERGEVAHTVPGADTRRPLAGEFRGASLVIKTLALPDAAGWADFFLIANEKKSENLLVSASGADTVVRSRVRDRLAGMIDVAGRLKQQTGGLSYFALSVLMKMPSSPMRDKLTDQFKQSPFTAEGLRSLLRAGSPVTGAGTAVEVVRFDTQKQTVNTAVDRVELFLVRAGAVLSLTAHKAAFTPGDILLAAPRGLFTAGELASLTGETDPGRQLLLMNDRYLEIKKAGKAPALLFTGLFAARFTADNA
jgi:hypothetical protein